MTRIQVHAGQSMLESYVKKPSVGLCELIWNSFDEDVRITVETNVLGGLERILVEDDGNGMTAENASSAVATVGDSWKRMPGTLSRGKRPVHGRHGSGRFAAFGLGLSIQWRSTAEAIEGGLAGVLVIGSGTDLRHMDVSHTPAEAESGTVVTIGLLGVTPVSRSIGCESPCSPRERAGRLTPCRRRGSGTLLSRWSGS